MHLFGSFLVILHSIRFAVLSLPPIKPDKIEIWAPWVINEHKLLSDKWKAHSGNSSCTLVRGFHKAAQAAVAVFAVEPLEHRVSRVFWERQWFLTAGNEHAAGDRVSVGCSPQTLRSCDTQRLLSITRVETELIKVLWKAGRKLHLMKHLPPRGFGTLSTVSPLVLWGNGAFPLQRSCQVCS